MISNKYNWKRFWCPPEGRYYPEGGGYLVDPDSENSTYLQPKVVSFDKISDAPCLMMLGEPGTGKSVAMEMLIDKIKPEIEAKGNSILKFDLGAYDTGQHLCQEIFQNAVVTEWLQGSNQLHLFLDSLDESIVHVQTVEKLLGEELNKIPIERLYFRIACRTAVNPSHLQIKLEGFYGKDNVKVYELLPLRRKDVIEAAKGYGLDHEALIKEINRVEAVPFAIKPLTLRLLINQFRKDGKLPSNRFDLFLTGCTQLCEETYDRKRSGAGGNYNAVQRLAVASHIAVITAFCKKYAVWQDSDRNDVPKEDITIRELRGGFEKVGDNRFEVTDEAIKETLNTGLFSSRGSSRMGWSHKVYEEFLAARYLINHNLALKNIVSLITALDGKPVPQLQEIASWLASSNLEILDYIMEVDPKILLNGDIFNAQSDFKEKLTIKLLKFFEEGKLHDDHAFRDKFWKLNHKGLAEQLRALIIDKGNNSLARRVAIDIAEKCQVESLQNELLGLVLNKDEPHHIRVNAAYAINRIGNENAKLKLKPLVFGEVGDDPDDELKGCSLSALWPNHMTAEELFKSLTFPKKSPFIGAYRMFISYEVKKYLEPDDLQIALKWAEKQPLKEISTGRFSDLADDIIKLSWDYFDNDDIQSGFAKAVYFRLKNHDYSIMEVIDDDEKRRKLITNIVQFIDDPDKESWHLIHATLISNNDFEWLIDNLRTEKVGHIHKVWAHLIRRMFYYEIKKINMIFNAIKDSPVLKELFCDLTDPIELESQKAQDLRKRYYKHQEIIQEREQCSPLDPPPGMRIMTRLEQFESGDMMGFWYLTMEMTLSPDSTHYGYELNPFLTNLPGWEKADEQSRIRIIEAAKKYVIEGNPQTEEWVGTDQIYHSAAAGYKALIFLKEIAPSFLNNLNTDIWKRWAPIIISYPTESGFENDKFHNELVTIAYQHAPEEIINNLLILIDKENLNIIRKVENCWDYRLEMALLKKVTDEKLKPKCMGVILVELFDHDVEDAIKYAESLIKIPPPKDQINRERMLVIARLLMEKNSDTWPLLWSAIQQDSQFGRELIEMDYERDSYAVRTTRNLSEDQLADLYIWLQEQYPYEEDHPNLQGWVGPRDRVSDFKRGIVIYLEKIGKSEACDAIRKIMQECPELDWLKWTLERAEEVTRQESWEALTPKQLMELVGSTDKRFIRNASELLETVIESLERLEKDKLHADLPAVDDLWYEDRPKDENHFSNYIVRHLRQDLLDKTVIVNREVQIHRGQRTDIHVDAISVDPATKNVLNKCTVIIEVKGCWHDQIGTAMEDQLINKYLKDNLCNHGLYLVGWFCCDYWEDCIKKRKALKLGKIQKVRENFQKQAEALAKKYSMNIRSVVIDASIH